MTIFLLRKSFHFISDRQTDRYHYSLHEVSPTFLQLCHPPFRRAPRAVRDGQPGGGGADPPAAVHAAAVHEEHAGQLHEAQAHHPRRLHLCRVGLVGPERKTLFPNQ